MTTPALEKTPKRFLSTSSDSSIDASPSNPPLKETNNAKDKKDKQKSKKAKVDKTQPTIEEITGKMDKAKENPDLNARLERMELMLSKVVTKQDIQIQMKKLVTAEQLQTTIEKLSHNFEKTISILKTEHEDNLERLKAEMHDIVIENQKLKSTVAKITASNEETKQQLYFLSQECQENNSSLNDLEQHGRANSIRITGLEDQNPNESIEDTVSLIVKLCTTKLGINLDPNEIDTAHRLGVHKTGKTRAIICKFVRRRSKFQVIKNRPKLKKSGIVITEDITRKNQELLSRAYQCRERELQGAWVMNGKIRVKTINNEIRLIRSHDDLDGILSSQGNR